MSIIKTFKFDDLDMAIVLQDQKFYIKIIWETDYLIDDGQWFRLGPVPCDSRDFCHEVSKVGNRVILPPKPPMPWHLVYNGSTYWNLTREILDYEIKEIALHLIGAGTSGPIYQNISSPIIKLDVIRNAFKMPVKIIDEKACPVCFEDDPGIVMITAYQYAHVVCKICINTINKCPFTDNDIIYTLDDQGFFQHERWRKKFLEGLHSATK